MWSSFRVSDAAFATAMDKIRKSETIYSWSFWTHVGEYLDLCFKYVIIIYYYLLFFYYYDDLFKYFFRSIIASFSMPDILTKWWSLFLFTLQV